MFISFISQPPYCNCVYNIKDKVWDVQIKVINIVDDRLLITLSIMLLIISNIVVHLDMQNDKAIMKIAKGHIVNVMYRGVYDLAEVLNVNKYVGYTRVLISVLTDNGRVKTTVDLQDILSIHSN